MEVRRRDVRPQCRVTRQSGSRQHHDPQRSLATLALAEGEARDGEIERRLAAGPVISVPTITLEGDANGAPHPDARACAKKFSGKYSHRLLAGGIGHNLPQEAPQAFVQAVIDVDKQSST
jgi:pimeloyl-ACP methyl ester carboxylesterase